VSDVRRIVVKPTPGISSEQARDARARALRYAFDRYAEKREVAGIGDDHTEGEHKNGSKPRL
jgi:hypothetical protein